MPAETVYDVLIRAIRVATERSDGAVGSAHLTLALLDGDAQDRAQQLLNHFAIKRAELRIYVEATLETNAMRAQTAPRPSVAASRMLNAASRQAHDYDEAENQNALLLIELVIERSPNGEVLRSLGLKPEALRLALRNLTRAARAGGNPLKLLDADAKAALDAADNARRAAFCGRVSTAHLLLGILENRELYALQALISNGVDLDELAQLTRAALSGDGETATPEIRLTPAAKRALDRARDVAPSRTQKQPISPQALLWGLLPHPVSWRERRTWGEVSDPLEGVWRQFGIAVIERVLGVLLGVESLAAQPPKRVIMEARPITGTKARLDWKWMVPGVLWTLLCAVALLTFGQQNSEDWSTGFVVVLGVARLIELRGRLTKSQVLRSRAASFVAGCIAMVVVCAIALLLGGLLR